MKPCASVLTRERYGWRLWIRRSHANRYSIVQYLRGKTGKRAEPRSETLLTLNEISMDISWKNICSLLQVLGQWERRQKAGRRAKIVRGSRREKVKGSFPFFSPWTLNRLGYLKCLHQEKKWVREQIRPFTQVRVHDKTQGYTEERSVTKPNTNWQD